MGFRIDDIWLDNPRPAGTPFSVTYMVVNGGGDEPYHEDRVEMWGSDGSKPVDVKKSVISVAAGDMYSETFNVPALSPGFYDVSITFPDGSGRGGTIEVQ